MNDKTSPGRAQRPVSTGITAAPPCHRVYVPSPPRTSIGESQLQGWLEILKGNGIRKTGTVKPTPWQGMVKPRDSCIGFEYMHTLECTAGFGFVVTQGMTLPFQQLIPFSNCTLCCSPLSSVARIKNSQRVGTKKTIASSTHVVR